MKQQNIIAETIKATNESIAFMRQQIEKGDDSRGYNFVVKLNSVLTATCTETGTVGTTHGFNPQRFKKVTADLIAALSWKNHDGSPLIPKVMPWKEWFDSEIASQIELKSFLESQ